MYFHLLLGITMPETLTQPELETSDANAPVVSFDNVSIAFDLKVVLKDIYLSYFYGAKIGVLGLNGSGKSTLLAYLRANFKFPLGYCLNPDEIDRELKSGRVYLGWQAPIDETELQKFTRGHLLGDKVAGPTPISRRWRASRSSASSAVTTVWAA